MINFPDLLLHSFSEHERMKYARNVIYLGRSEKHLGFYFWCKPAEIHIPISTKHSRFRNCHLWRSHSEKIKSVWFKGQKEGGNDGFPLAGAGFNFEQSKVASDLLILLRAQDFTNG